MKKIDLILSTVEKLDNGQGITTNDIGTELGMERSNVSKCLNSLVKDGYLYKSNTRPVKYHFNNPNNIDYSTTSPLDRLSYLYPTLSSSVKLAKTAIIYPPNGMNSLIIGDTGVGKSMLATLMHEYAATLYPEKNMPFIHFNCSDYSNNVQLLSSHLFGVKKGTFTGATEDRPGLIEKADGGILFLDEIHNLPSEGQEMLFLYMDTGYFRRFGEVSKKIKSSARIICATNMDINESLLNTFLRRIPIKISIPSLNDRLLEERLTLIESFLKYEASKLDKQVLVSYNAMLCLLTYNCPYNIGQLKNDIKLAVANAFTEYFINNKKQIKINSPDLPNEMRYNHNNQLTKEKDLLKSLDSIDGYFIYSKDTAIVSHSFTKQKQVIFASYKKLVQEFDTEISLKECSKSNLEKIFNEYLYTIDKNSESYHYNFSSNIFEEIIQSLIKCDEKLDLVFKDDIFKKLFTIHLDLIYERMCLLKYAPINLENKLKVHFSDLYKSSLKCKSIFEDCLNLYLSPTEFIYIFLAVLLANNK